MNIPLYRLLELTARESEILWFAKWQNEIIIAIVVLSLIFCFLGFYCYRCTVSGLVFIGVVLASFLWIYPAFGKQTAATIAAVIGVVMAFLGFRFFRLGGVMLCGLIAGSLVWQFAEQSTYTIVFIILAAVAAGVLSFFFPLWSICGFTALWGAITFANEGWLIFGFMDGIGTKELVLIEACMAVIGFIIQILLFRKQKIFKKIMPERIEYRIEKLREKRGKKA